MSAAAHYRLIHVAVVVSGGTGITERQLTIAQGSQQPPPDPIIPVMTITGSGEATTRLFAIPPGSDWGVGWVYACPNGFNSFEFEVYRSPSDLPDLNDTTPFDLNTRGHGAKWFGDSGTFYFQVITNCAWKMFVGYQPLNVPTPPSPVGPSIALSVPAPLVSQLGGSLTVKAAVRNAQACTYITVPLIPGLDGTAPCRNGSYVRSGHLPRSSVARPVYVEVVAANATGLTTATTRVLQQSPKVLPKPAILSVAAHPIDLPSSGATVMLTARVSGSATCTFSGGEATITVPCSSGAASGRQLIGAGDHGNAPVSITETPHLHASVMHR